MLVKLTASLVQGWASVRLTSEAGLGVALGQLNFLRTPGAILQFALLTVTLRAGVGAGADSAVVASVTRGVTRVSSQRPDRPATVHIYSRHGVTASDYRTTPPSNSTN